MLESESVEVTDVNNRQAEAGSSNVMQEPPPHWLRGGIWGLHKCPNAHQNAFNLLMQ